MHKPCRTLVDLFRPSTPLIITKKLDVDARDKRGHDERESVNSQDRWYNTTDRDGWDEQLVQGASVQL